MKVGIGLLSAIFGVGGGLGLVLSGVIVDHVSWRWIFVVGAIGVAIALVLVRRFVPESPVRSTSRIDVPGAVLLSVVLVTLLLGAVRGRELGLDVARRARAVRARPPASAVLWVVLELHVDQPLIDIRVLAERPVLLTNVTALISGFAMFGSFVLVPRFVEAPGGLPAEDRRTGRLRVRRERDDDRPLPPSRVAADAVRRARRRAARTPRRVEVAAGDRHGLIADLGRRRSPRSTTSPGRSSCRWQG